MLIILLNITENNGIIYFSQVTKENTTFVKISKCRLKKSNIYLVIICNIYILIQHILIIRFVHDPQSGLWRNIKSGNNFVHHCRIKRGIPGYKTIKQLLIIIKIDVTASCIFFQCELKTIFVYIFEYHQNNKNNADDKSCLVRKLHF